MSSAGRKPLYDTSKPPVDESAMKLGVNSHIPSPINSSTPHLVPSGIWRPAMSSGLTTSAPCISGSSML
eukprot:2175968-Rhodomonas_salina.1